MVTASLPYFSAAMSTSAATVSPAAPSATGLGEPWNHGPKRFRCSGIVNSNPYSTWPVPSAAYPTDAPLIVALWALLACSEKVVGDPGIRQSIAALHAALPSG